MEDDRVVALNLLKHLAGQKAHHCQCWQQAPRQSHSWGLGWALAPRCLASSASQDRQHCKSGDASAKPPPLPLPQESKTWRFGSLAMLGTLHLDPAG
eukprot:2813809-Amphidinium_carterae.1